ncbi:hypothetical protein MUY14_38415 [Amycolatopsis sp. FBCC-B4732]|uniref:hypothetical protein n=1 Tax=Amycolatopsis sp. FBCC-B4732 TaxID=3079339 RepID=UPI001FF45F42|nr:hypothetical protein [Amycolatopsis sp. FBCC-B4732]UOX87540.1 hypothetical protein MUY14_38415 [Amycolatopsis sp. FBCC-B4732]
MTYPPQPGQPGQPDPYGQQPQSGGFPQQPYPQQGGWDPNQQQQPYPTQQYPQGWDPSQQQQQGYPSGGFPASPQPQWGDPNAQQQSAWADPNAQQYGQQAWDPNQGGQMSGWDPNQAGYAQGFGGPPAPPKKSKTGMWIAVGATVVVVLAALGVTGFVAPGFFLSKDDNTNVAAPPSSSTSAKPTSPKTTTPKKSTTPTSKAPTGSGASDAKAVLQGFIDKLNSGDKTGAIALGCADSKDLLGSWLDTFLKPPLKLELGEVPDDEYLVEGQVTGTSAGKNVKGTLSATNFDDKGFCVSTMLVS